RADTCLTSAGGTYRLCLGATGAVTVMKGSSVLWSSGVTAADAAMLRVRADGNLVLYRTGGQVRWHASTGGTAADRLIVATGGEAAVQPRRQPVVDEAEHAVAHLAAAVRCRGALVGRRPAHVARHQQRCPRVVGFRPVPHGEQEGLHDRRRLGLPLHLRQRQRL